MDSPCRVPPFLCFEIPFCSVLRVSEIYRPHPNVCVFEQRLVVLLWGRGRFPFTYVGSRNGVVFFSNVNAEEDQFLDKASFLFPALVLVNLEACVCYQGAGIRLLNKCGVVRTSLVVILCSQIVKAILC